LGEAISKHLADFKEFAAKVHAGESKAPNGKPFWQLLLIGIGGSALGPQIVNPHFSFL